MSSLKFIDYMNISSLSAISFVNASLIYLNTTNNNNNNINGTGSTAYPNVSYGSGANFTGAGSAGMLGMSSSPLPALFSLNGTALDFGLLPAGGPAGGGPGGSYPAPNYSFPFHNFVQKEFIFDRTDVRVIFITLYSLVFCCCFFGNLLVILVVTMSRRLRSITNFFLANLAVADLCVGVFCVMQNLTIYLIESWVFGDFLCKMYQFVHSLSYTASIFILVVICTERYFAIIHPITCKQILTSRRLRLVIVAVWITSAVYSVPKFIFVRTITNNLGDDQLETICIVNRKAFNSELFDIINFALLYLLPLLVMTILYSRIAIALWKSSRGLERHIALQNTTSSNYSNNFHRKPSSKYEKRAVGVTESQVSVESDKVVVTTWRSQNSFHQQRHHGTQLTQVSHSSNNVLRARRGVIRMLMVVVLTFALCNLPFHARKMWQYWSTDYKGDSNFNALFTPLTFLVTYFNSGVNPLLYAFLSRNFRKGMRELLLCSFKKNKNKSLNQRIPMHCEALLETLGDGGGNGPAAAAAAAAPLGVRWHPGPVPKTTETTTTQFSPLDRTAEAAAGTGLLASCNYNNNTKNFVPGATTIITGTAPPAAGSSCSKSKWPKRPTAATSATSRPSRITKMMNRLRRPRPGRRTKDDTKRVVADSSSFLDDDDEEDTTTCGGNEFVSTATVTFALSTVYCVDCDEGTAGEP